MEQKGVLELALIHHVFTPDEHELPNCHDRIVFFFSYMGAVQHCLERDIITPLEATDILEQTLLEIDEIEDIKRSRWYTCFKKEEEVLRLLIQSRL